MRKMNHVVTFQQRNHLWIHINVIGFLNEQIEYHFCCILWKSYRISSSHFTGVYWYRNGKYWTAIQINQSSHSIQIDQFPNVICIVNVTILRRLFSWSVRRSLLLLIKKRVVNNSLYFKSIFHCLILIIIITIFRRKHCFLQKLQFTKKWMK